MAVRAKWNDATYHGRIRRVDRRQINADVLMGVVHAILFSSVVWLAPWLLGCERMSQLASKIKGILPMQLTLGHFDVDADAVI